MRRAPEARSYTPAGPGRVRIIRALLRSKEPVYAELGLDGPQWSDAELIAAMVRHPVLMNRPIVQTPLGTRLCRPPEEVLGLLPDDAGP